MGACHPRLLDVIKYRCPSRANRWWGLNPVILPKNNLVPSFSPDRIRSSDEDSSDDLSVATCDVGVFNVSFGGACGAAPTASTAVPGAPVLPRTESPSTSPPVESGELSVKSIPALSSEILIMCPKSYVINVRQGTTKSKCTPIYFL